jgi:hypothetical protein
MIRILAVISLFTLVGCMEPFPSRHMISLFAQECVNSGKYYHIVYDDTKVILKCVSSPSDLEQ